MPTTQLNRELIQDALEGLGRSSRSLPCKWFYDERGSRLFDQICELPEYYPTRTELKITQRHAAEIAAELGENIELVEFGSGSSLKTRVLLRHLKAVAAYCPLDISREHLLEAARQLGSEFPALRIFPLVADYTNALSLPLSQGAKRVLYFPGSTIGNFTPEEAIDFLQRARQLADWLLIGVDVEKPESVLLDAYNDKAGVTAQFNLNLLERLNREADADFDLSNWRHQAIWNPRESRIEMRLVSRIAQTVCLAGSPFEFEAGQWITTEFSHKWSLPAFAGLAGEAGWVAQHQWTDENGWFSVQLLHSR